MEPNAFRNWFENIWYSKEKTSVISFNIEGIHPYIGNN
jgi:hypothetical protein